MTKRERKAPGRRLAAVVMLFYFLAFLLLAIRNQSALGFVLSIVVPAMIFIGTNFLPHLFPADRLLLSLTNFLCAMGILLLYSTNQDYARQQAVFYGVGLVCMISCIYLVRLLHSWQKWIRILIPLSLVMMVLPLIFGHEINGARNWITFGSVSFQPSEIVKLALVLVLAWFISRRQFLPCLLFTAFCLGLLMLQMDLGTALLYYGTALLTYWAASGSILFSMLGVAGGVGASLIGYHQFAHVRRRVAIWLNPWADYENAGYQLVKGLEAIANGGLWGVGLGLGSPTKIPVYESDFIFAVLYEQFGQVFGICVILMYVALIWRCTTIARSARRSFYGLLAMASTIMLGLQTFVIIGGILKVIPLTGVTLPFISYGGTSLVSSMCLVGLIQGVESINEDDLKEDLRLSMMDE